MVNPKIEIERKFLVRDATLRDVPGLQLIEIESTYLDLAKLMKTGSSVGIIVNNTNTTTQEVRVTKEETDNSTSYWLTSKVGGPSISRSESITEIDKEIFTKVKSQFGKAKVQKKRFKFVYHNNTFELDVFPDAKVMIMEVELEKEMQLFALPPFVNIVKEVTGDPRYYNSNIAKQLTI